MDTIQLGELLYEIEEYANRLDMQLVIDFGLCRAYLRDPATKKDHCWSFANTWEKALKDLSYVLLLKVPEKD